MNAIASIVEYLRVLASNHREVGRFGAADEAEAHAATLELFDVAMILRPGDKVVLKVPALDAEQRRLLEDLCRTAFEGHPVVLLDDDSIDISIQRPS